MTTPIAPISLLDIQNEFGGGGSISLNEYYSNAGLVPSPPPTSPYQTSGISYGGRIDIGMFRGLQKVTQLPSFLLARLAAVCDRYATYRLYLDSGNLTILSATSGFSTKWLQLMSIPTIADLRFGATAAISITNQERATGVPIILHNPSQAEPYIDFRFDDEAPSSYVNFIAEIRLTLGLGITSNPPAYTGPISGGSFTSVNAGTWGNYYDSIPTNDLTQGTSPWLGTFASQDSLLLPAFPWKPIKYSAPR